MTHHLDFWITHAINEIGKTYGDTVSAWEKGKSLTKFGRTGNADSGVLTTVSEFQGSVVNETFVSTNIIDAVVSSSGSDTQTVQIEGHTIDGNGLLTFVTQEVTLTGQTPVALPTPMARANRIYVKDSGTFNSPQSAVVGNIAVYDDTDGATTGVPNTDAATKLMMTAGLTSSKKCATSISNNDYWILDAFHCNVEERGPAAAADFHIEIRDVANGGIWRRLGAEMSLNSGGQSHGDEEFKPFFIVPKNHDMRLITISDTANTFVSGEVDGVLAKVIS